MAQCVSLGSRCCVIVSRLNLVAPVQGSGSVLKFVASCDCRPLGRYVARPDVPYSTERCAARQIADAFERIAALDAPVTPSPSNGSQQSPVSESSSSSMVCSWPHDVHRHVAPSSKPVFLPVIRRLTFRTSSAVTPCAPHSRGRRLRLIVVGR